MSASMVERIARAIFIAQNVGPKFVDDPEEQSDIERSWRGYIPEALAVLAAMRAPTRGILEAMRNTVPIDGHEWEYVEAEASAHWSAMIDAALVEKVE